MLGVLLAAILLLAVAFSLRVYTQLDRAQRVQRSLVYAQRELDAVLRVQLEESADLRGFLASGQTIFLEPDLRAGGRFEAAVGAVRARANDLGMTEMVAPLQELHVLHETWLAQVARPLMTHPKARDAPERQTVGKVLVDRESVAVERMHGVIQSQLTATDDLLTSRINEGLLSGLASAVLFGIVSIVFVLSSRAMIAAIDRERGIVETLQGAFRTDLDALPGARVGTAYLSADRDAAVGGDLYDVRELDATHGLLIVADISGKGVRAAVNTAFVKYSIRTLALSYADPARLLERFNEVFMQTVADPNLFVVAFVGIYDATQRMLTYASAGHSGAYVRRGTSVTALDVTGPIIGLDERFTFQSREFALVPGDVLLLATDGLTEARDRTGALLQDSGAMSWLEGASREPQQCADQLVRAVRERNGGVVRDDLALLVIAFD
ncbi:MAG: hypothetical protein NVS2B8_19880 [Vulcanimicrobiaceae bacterium]